MSSDATPPLPLPPEHYETFVRLFVHHEGRLRGFLRYPWSGTGTMWMRSCRRRSLVAWRKFNQFDPDTNFMAWAAAIARFEALKHLRKQSRDRLVFNDDILDLLAEESLDEVDALERHRSGMGKVLWRRWTPGRRSCCSSLISPG